MEPPGAEPTPKKPGAAARNATPSNVEAATSTEPKKLVLWRMDLSVYSRNTQFGVLAGGALVSAVVFSYLQEMIFTMPNFHYGGLVSLMTTLTYCLCAGIDAHFCVEGGLQRRASYREWLLLSLFPAAGMYFTNWSLNYLNYPTRIMFKSSKVIPVMIVGSLMQNKSYSLKQYANATLLVFGLAIFCLGEKELSPKFSFIGLFLILIGIMCDAITSNMEEHTFFSKHGCTVQDVTFFAYLFGSMWTAITMLMTKEAFEAFVYAQEHPEVLQYGFISSAAGYTSVIFVLLLIQHFGATVTEVVKSCRKVFSIVVSYTLLAPKPFSQKHMLGGFLFALSLAIGAYR